MKNNPLKTLILFGLLSIFATSCKKDNEPEILAPTATNVEIGTANNKQAIRGRDFHLNADVVAGDKIKGVEIKILQKTGQTYTATWKFDSNSGRNLSRFSITRHLITCAFFLDASKFSNFDKPRSTAALYLPIL